MAHVRAERWTAFAPWPQSLQAEVDRSRAAPSESADGYAHAFALACQLGDPCWEGIAARGSGLLQADAGDTRSALAWLEDATERCNRWPDTYQWVHAFVLDAGLPGHGRHRGPERAGLGRTAGRARRPGWHAGDGHPCPCAPGPPRPGRSGGGRRPGGRRGRQPGPRRPRRRRLNLPPGSEPGAHLVPLVLTGHRRTRAAPRLAPWVRVRVGLSPEQGQRRRTKAASVMTQSSDPGFAAVAVAGRPVRAAPDPAQVWLEDGDGRAGSADVTRVGLSGEIDLAAASTSTSRGGGDRPRPAGGRRRQPGHFMDSVGVGFIARLIIAGREAGWRPRGRGPSGRSSRR